LLNGGSDADFFKLSVRGIPPEWVTLPSPVVRIREGEQRDAKLVIQPPDSAQMRVGRHPLVVRVVSHAVPDDVVELEGTLTVAAIEAKGPVSLLLASNDFPAVPGERTTVTAVLLNEGDEEESVQLAIEGIPANWVSFPSAPTPLAAGQQTEVAFTIRPPADTESRAGRHRFSIRVIGRASPDCISEAECVLTVGTYAAFVAALNPLQAAEGEPVQISVENQGNFQQVFHLMWRSLNDELAFDSGSTQQLRVPAGQTEVAEVRAVPRSRPLVGGPMGHPYTVRVQSADHETQDLRGEFISRARIPSLVVLLLVVLVLVLIGLSLFALGGGDLAGLGLVIPTLLE
jgi:uncharacterized membrane protein